MKAAYFAIPLATAFSVVSLPAGAETRLGLELIRVREGSVKPLPVFDDIQSSRAATVPVGQQVNQNLIAQSNPSGEGGPSGVRNISPADTRFSINFECSLVADEPEVQPGIPALWKKIPLITRVDLVKDDSGDLVKSYEGNWQLSNDFTRITFDISDVEKVPGQVYRFDFYPQAPCERTDERRFRVPAAAATTGGGGNWWIIPAVLGLGVGICAIAGCFDSGGGGGGGGGGGRSSR